MSGGPEVFESKSLLRFRRAPENSGRFQIMLEESLKGSRALRQCLAGSGGHRSVDNV